MTLLLALLSWDAVIAEAMRGLDGTALVADLKTGEELGVFNRQKATERWASPGSTIKPFVLAALIDEGKFDRSIGLWCNREVRIDGRRFDCSHPDTGTPMYARDAIAYSCNRYFAEIQVRIPPNALRQRLRSYGFTVDEGAQGPLLALGESGVRITPKSLLAAYSKLARRRQESALAVVFEGLAAAVLHGTAQLAGEGIAGKTGTVASPGRTTSYAWFAGWAPLGDPRHAAVIFLEQGTGGGNAAPVAGRILHGGRGGTVRVAMKNGPIKPYTLDEYVTSVLAGEAADFPEGEAMKAMAVTARTFAVAHRGRHVQEGFDFCGGTHCQNLVASRSLERYRQTVEQTADELIWHQGTVAKVYYHRHCGGVTEPADAVWPGFRAPYLTQINDTFCLTRGRPAWRAPVQAEQFEIVSRSASGRVSRVRIDGRTLSFDQFQHQTASAVRSAFFQVNRKPGGFLLEGYGDGHGVGLCQLGALERARAGHGYREILAAYFPGTRVAINAAGLTWSRLASERLILVSTNTSQDRRVLAAADQALSDAERRIGWRLDGPAEVRVYPSVAAFRDATGEPGWILASTLRRTIRLQPRGDPALLHEMLHLLVEQRARRYLPDWFREGIVLYLENPKALVTTANAGPEADMRRDYQASLSRVRDLVARHGLPKVLTWIFEPGL